MQRALGGYTVIEVMIFLAISSALLAVTIVSIRGQVAHTEFVSSMNNVTSKMQQWIDEVANGYTSAQVAESSNYVCGVGIDGRPFLQSAATPSAAGVGTNADCIVLGKAIQFTTSALSSYSDRIYAYTVLGLRTYTVGGIESLSDTIAHANPAPAINGVDLTEEFKIPNGARVLSIKSSTPSAVDSRMAGFFVGFKGKSVDLPGGYNNGSPAVQAVQYPLNNNAIPRDPTEIQECLKLRAPSPCAVAFGAEPPALNSWQICFESTRNDEKAQLSVISTNGLGASTQLKLDAGAIC